MCMSAKEIAIIEALTVAGNTAGVLTVCAVLRAEQEKLDLQSVAEDERRRVARRPAAAARQRRRRERAVGDLFEQDNEQRYIDAAISIEKSSHAESRQQEIPPIPPKETTSSLRSSELVSGGGSPRARGQSLPDQEALAIYDDALEHANIDPRKCPPGWRSGAVTIQKFLDSGCPGIAIRLAIQAELARITPSVPERFGYFERPIARAFSNHQRKIPTVEIINGGRSESPGRTTRYEPRRSEPRRKTMREVFDHIDDVFDAKIAAGMRSGQPAYGVLSAR
jgi:hypothetical protein